MFSFNLHYILISCIMNKFLFRERGRERAGERLERRGGREREREREGRERKTERERAQ